MSTCLNEFKCDPFDHTNQTLQSLQSRIPVTDVPTAVLKSAKENGTSKVKEFLHDRVHSNTKYLNARVHSCKCENFSTQELKKEDGG